jgi:hypothetical protein
METYKQYINDIFKYNYFLKNVQIDFCDVDIDKQIYSWNSLKKQYKKHIFHIFFDAIIGFYLIFHFK